MDLNNKRHLLIFILPASLGAYLLKAALSAVFVVSVPMAPDWCLDYQEIQTGPDDFSYRCVAYKSPLEEAKHRHNLQMIDRNKVLFAIEFVLWFGIAALAFHWVPTWKGIRTSVSGGEKFISLGVLAFVVLVVGPLVLSWLLPPPVDWFPGVFREINEAQVQEALRGIYQSL